VKFFYIKILICAFLSSWFLHVYSQTNYNIDSLYKVKLSVKDVEPQISANIDLANAFVRSDLQRAATFALDAKMLLNNYQGDSSKTWVKKTESRVFDVIANIETVKGNVKHAIDIYDKSIRIKKELNDKKGVALSINNIGYLFLQQNEPQKAFSYFKIALNSLKVLNDTVGVGVALGNMGLSMFYLHGVDSSLHYYYLAKKHLENSNSNQYLPSTYNSIGSLLSRKKEYQSANEYYQKSLKISSEINDKLSASRTYGKLATLNNEQGKTKQAVLYGEEGLSLAKKFGSVEAIADLTSILHTIHTKNGNYEKALFYYKEHIKARDTLANVNNARELLKKEMTHIFDTERVKDSIKVVKEQEILEMQHQQEVQKQRMYIYIGLGGLLITIFFASYMYRAFVNKKKLSLDLSAKNKAITDSISYAKRIQGAILPPIKSFYQFLPNSFILYKPKDIVAGDFYWMEHKDGKVLFAAADCTGHGVPGAMVSVICNNGLNRSVREYNLTDPCKILDKTREIVIQEFEKSEDEVKDGMDIALCSLHNNILQYAGANNPLWIIRSNTTEIEEIKATKQPIGKYGNPEPYITHTIELQKGDSIYIFSDGYADQFGGEKGKKFKGANFKKLLLSIQHESMERQKELINEAFENWRGKLEQIDDVCVIGVRV
jgi:serine phosphatase RsbU (regulator of sigma subunit)/tetratricopeptide (TPR) repeat protein